MYDGIFLRVWILTLNYDFVLYYTLNIKEIKYLNIKYLDIKEILSVSSWINY